MYGMEWSVMEWVPSNTTHSPNFPFPPNWEVSNGMEHLNNAITTLSLLFIPNFVLPRTIPSFFPLHPFLFQSTLIFSCLHCSSPPLLFCITSLQQGNSYSPSLFMLLMLLFLIAEPRFLLLYLIKAIMFTFQIFMSTFIIF